MRVYREDTQRPALSMSEPDTWSELIARLWDRLRDKLWPIWCSGCYQNVPREVAGWSATRNYGDRRNVAEYEHHHWCPACMAEGKDNR
jgi:hypothetical protein